MAARYESRITLRTRPLYPHRPSRPHVQKPAREQARYADTNSRLARLPSSVRSNFEALCDFASLREHPRPRLLERMFTPRRKVTKSASDVLNVEHVAVPNGRAFAPCGQRCKRVQSSNYLIHPWAHPSPLRSASPCLESALDLVSPSAPSSLQVPGSPRVRNRSLGFSSS